jgi:chemotaxis protein MotA
MADATKPAGRPSPAVPGAVPSSGARPDLATIGGILLALVGLIGGLLLEKGKLSDITQMTAAMIVLGGTFGAVLITTPLSVVKRAIGGLRGVVMEAPNRFAATIEEIIGYATQARKNGIVSLEGAASRVADPFLRKALNLAVDGTDLQELRHMMELELDLAEQRYEAEAKVWEAAGGYAPTIGIIGAVMGLIQVMKHLENIKEVGNGIAVAFVATVYGVGVSNILFLPAAQKLRSRASDIMLLRQMMLEGVIGIVEGLNPKLIRIKLEAFAGPDPAPAATPSPQAAPAPAKGGTVAA